ncbi:MAG: hypothetical protein ACI4E1_08715 [Lachnospira sp.]
MQDDIQNEIAVAEEKQQLSIFKSVYYQMNAKPDSMSKAYSRKIIIDKDDIVELNNRVCEKINLNYEDDGFITSVTVDLKDRRVIVFKCWEEFIQHPWVETSSIMSISIQWNFNIRIPGYDLPQRHNLVVKLTNGLRPEEMLNLIFSGKIEDFDEVELNTFPVVARVDFIQALLGEELLNIVGEWVRGRKQNTASKNVVLILMKKYRKRIAQYFEYVSFIMTFILTVGINTYYIRGLNIDKLSDLSMTEFNNLLILLATSVMVIFLLKQIFEKLAENVYEKLSEYGRVFIFNITRGDKNLQDKINNSDKNSGKMILVKFVLSLIFNIGCGIITSLIC